MEALHVMPTRAKKKIPLPLLPGWHLSLAPRGRPRKRCAMRFWKSRTSYSNIKRLSSPRFLPPVPTVQPASESSQRCSSCRAPQRRRDDVVPGDGYAAGANAGAPSADHEPRRGEERPLHGHVGDGQTGLLFVFCVCVFFFFM